MKYQRKGMEMQYEPKYNMTQKENIFLVKKNIIDIIWKEANLEGIAVTYPDTSEIFEGRTVAGLTITETKAINNLKHAWQFVLDNIDLDVDILYLRHINGLLGAEGVIKDAGIIRHFDVKIGGTDWQPDIPDYDRITSKIQEVYMIGNPLERGLTLFCEICRGQWFSDGNKRTAQLAANAILIKNGSGILTIPQKQDREFKSKLIQYYETDNKTPLLNFLYDTSLDGSDFAKQRIAVQKERQQAQNKDSTPQNATKSAEQSAKLRNTSKTAQPKTRRSR
jgi:Fic family protein